MEPRKWIWIQGIAIAAAAAIGIGMAVWYQARPANTADSIPASAPPRKIVLRPPQPYVIPSVLPRKNTSGGTASATPDESDDAPSPPNSVQSDAVDPIIHSQPVPSQVPAGPYGASVPPPTSPTPYGISANGTEGTVPSPYSSPSDVPTASPGGSAYPSSPTISPFGGPSQSGDGPTTPTAPGVTPPATAPGTGPVDTGVPNIPSAPAGGSAGGTAPGV